MRLRCSGSGCRARTIPGRTQTSRAPWARTSGSNPGVGTITVGRAPCDRVREALQQPIGGPLRMQPADRGRRLRPDVSNLEQPGASEPAREQRSEGGHREWWRRHEHHVGARQGDCSCCRSGRRIRRSSLRGRCANGGYRLASRPNDVRCPRSSRCGTRAFGTREGRRPSCNCGAWRPGRRASRAGRALRSSGDAGRCRVHPGWVRAGTRTADARAEPAALAEPVPIAPDRGRTGAQARMPSGGGDSPAATSVH